MLQTLRKDRYAVGYSLNLVQGDYIDITLCGDFDTYLYLLDADFNVISKKDDNFSCGGLEEGEQIKRLILTSDNYYIIVTSCSPSVTGNFTLNVAKTTVPVKTFYVDALNGNNANDGQAPASALSSLSAATDSLNAEPCMGTIYVMSNILLQQSMNINFGVTILPYNNGNYTILRDTNICGESMINVYNSLSLGEANMTGNLTFDGGYDDVNFFIAYGSIIEMYNGVVDMYDGITLQNNNVKHNAWGGAVYADGGNFTMYGGTIRNNYATRAAGIGIWNTKFTMYDGTICNNVAIENEGGIGNYTNSIFTMYGGRITNNSADFGGGLGNYGVFNLINGIIDSNFSQNVGGGIFNASDFTMEGGKIERNISATNIGNGILHYSGNFILQGNVSLFNNDIATINDFSNWNISYILMEDAVTSNHPIKLTPAFYIGSGGVDIFGLDYEHCREMVIKSKNYTFKGEDINLFMLAGATKTTLAFSMDNNSIRIFEAPCSANDTTIYICKNTTINGMIYSDNSTAYEYIKVCDGCGELVRRINILLYSKMGNITGETNVTAAGNQAYSMENIAGATYLWACSNSDWQISDNGTANIMLDIQTEDTGTLTVTIISECGDTVIRSITITATITGIAKTGHAPSVRIFPNPTTSHLQITGYELRENTTIEIYDVAGKLLQTNIVNPQSEIVIDVSHLTNGMYYLRIIGKESITLKIIKN